MASFVNVPASAIIDPLLALGFRQFEYRGQIVMEKDHDCCRFVKIKVYTSIPFAGAGAVRKCGKDSIRVCTAYESSRKNFGIGKFPYIARVGTVDGVVQRMLGTVKLAWERGQEWFDQLQIKQVQDQ